jgi:hypothetical protein
MAYPSKANLETALSHISDALVENRTLRNAASAHMAFGEVIAHLLTQVAPDASYVDLSVPDVEFNDVIGE